jgi:hypothetical protein
MAEYLNIIVLFMLFIIYILLLYLNDLIFIFLDLLNYLNYNILELVIYMICFIVVKMVIVLFYILLIYWMDYSCKFSYPIFYILIYALFYIFYYFLSFHSISLYSFYPLSKSSSESSLLYNLFYYGLIDCSVFLSKLNSLLNIFISLESGGYDSNLELNYIDAIVMEQTNVNKLFDGNNKYNNICFTKNRLELGVRNSIARNRISIQEYHSSVPLDKQFTICDNNFFSGILAKAPASKSTLVNGMGEHFIKEIYLEIKKVLAPKVLTPKVLTLEGNNFLSLERNKVLLPKNVKVLLSESDSSIIELPRTLNSKECKDFFNSEIVKYKKLARFIYHLEEERQIIILNYLYRINALLNKSDSDYLLKQMHNYFLLFETSRKEEPFRSAQDFANGAESHPVIATIDSDDNYILYVISHLDYLLNSNNYSPELADLILKSFGFIDFDLGDKSKISRGMVYYNNNINIMVKVEEGKFEKFFYKVQEISKDANLVTHLQETEISSVSEFLFESSKLDPALLEVNNKINKKIEEIISS